MTQVVDKITPSILFKSQIMSDKVAFLVTLELERFVIIVGDIVTESIIWIIIEVFVAKGV